jgi:uncharacterized membrane protein YoaK (UPF0700 family)
VSASNGRGLTAPVAQEGILPFVLLGLTATTGIVDAVSFLALGHVFTANMTGNVVFLGFAVAGAQGLSVARSGAALAAFLGGHPRQINARCTDVRFRVQLTG